MTDNNLQKCLRALKLAKSDNEKFAALMMVTKTVKAEECDLGSRKQILQAVGLNFLSRLLRSTTIPEGCPATIFKSVALSILSNFCFDDEIAGSSWMQKQVPVFNEVILHLPGEDDILEQHTVADCYSCLLAMAATSQGQRHLLDGNAVPTLVEVIATETWGHEQALQVMLQLVVGLGRSLWTKHPSALNKFLSHLTAAFLKTEDASKFALCGTLALVFSTLSEDCIPKPFPSWLVALIRSLENIFKSRLGEAQREPALKLLSSLVSVLGISCLLPPAVTSIKTVLLMLHLTCVEIRMVLESRDIDLIKKKSEVLCACYILLEGTIHHLTSEEPVDLDPEQMIKLHTAMTGAFNAVIFFLSQVSVGDLQLFQTSTILIASIRALGAWLAEETSELRKEVISILPFLITICKNISCQRLLDCQTSKTETSMEGCGSHLAGQVSPSDTHSSKSGKGSLTATPKSNKPTDSDVRMEDDNLLAGTRNVDLSDPGLVAKLQAVRDQALFSLPRDRRVLFSGDASRVSEDDDASSTTGNTDVVRFLLPGLCHLTAEESSREVLIAEDVHSFLVSYFMSRLPELTALDARENPDVKDALASTCSIFLNLVVMEPHLAASHPSFHHLLDSLTALLPQTVYRQDLLILVANFTTLGLMLLRSQAHRIDLTSAQRQAFLSACVIFLSNSHSVIPHGRSHTLSLNDGYAEAWSDIVELWFLGIQTLTACVSLVSEVVPAILKAGWIPAMIKMLSLTKEDTTAKDVPELYLPLLCVLADTSAAARSIIKEAAGLKVARLYGFKDMETALER